MLNYPREVSDTIKDTEWDVEVSNIKSAKLFDLCQRLAQNTNFWDQKSTLSSIEQIRKTNNLDNMYEKRRGQGFIKTFKNSKERDLSISISNPKPLICIPKIKNQNSIFDLDMKKKYS